MRNSQKTVDIENLAALNTTVEKAYSMPIRNEALSALRAISQHEAKPENKVFRQLVNEMGADLKDGIGEYYYDLYLKESKDYDAYSNVTELIKAVTMKYSDMIGEDGSHVRVTKAYASFLVDLIMTGADLGIVTSEDPTFFERLASTQEKPESLVEGLLNLNFSECSRLARKARSRWEKRNNESGTNKQRVEHQTAYRRYGADGKPLPSAEGATTRPDSVYAPSDNEKSMTSVEIARFVKKQWPLFKRASYDATFWAISEAVTAGVMTPAESRGLIDKADKVFHKVVKG